MTVVQLAFGVGRTPSSLAIVEWVVEMTKRRIVVRAASSIHGFIMQTSVIHQRIRLLKHRFGEKFSNTGTISTGKQRACAFIGSVDDLFNRYQKRQSLQRWILLRTSLYAQVRSQALTNYRNSCSIASLPIQFWPVKSLSASPQSQYTEPLEYWSTIDLNKNTERVQVKISPT